MKKLTILLLLSLLFIPINVLTYSKGGHCVTEGITDTQCEAEHRYYNTYIRSNDRSNDSNANDNIILVVIIIWIIGVMMIIAWYNISNTSKPKSITNNTIGEKLIQQRHMDKSMQKFSYKASSFITTNCGGCGNKLGSNDQFCMECGLSQ